MDSRQTELGILSKDLVNQLSIALRTAHIHDANNVAVASVIDKLVEMINQLVREERTVNLELREEFFYINDYRLRYSLEYLLNFDFLVREFRKRALGSVVFKDQVKAEDIKTFISSFVAATSAVEPFEAIKGGMAGVGAIDIGRLRRIIQDSALDLDPRRMVKKTYFKAVSCTRSLINNLKSGERGNIKKAKRVVESMVDLLIEEEQLLLGMTAIKDYDEYTYFHSVNVSILSIALGQRLGLNRKMLTELGLVALFHDSGKMEIPNEILNKTTTLTDDEWRIIRKHPIWGVSTLLKIRNLEPITIRSAIVAFEHHMHFDFSGYPKVRKVFELDFFGRIVSVADQYDAMTSSRVYSRIPMSPDKALSVMREHAGTQLDPLIFKFFTNMIGIFPIGTLVLLNTREMGFVYGSNQLFASRPQVMIIINGSGTRQQQGTVVDLTEKNSHGEYIRSITKTLDPDNYKINLAEYLM
jgi:HD-GYP domain-containing protein (c-di-GMP phosphodiesterase class II)